MGKRPARPGPRPARALRGTGALCEVSARGFAWREGWKRLGVARSPCRDPRAGSLPVLALAAGTRPVARAARLVSDPRRRRAVRAAAGAGDAGTGCARHRLRRAGALPMPCEIRCAGQPCGFTGFALGRWAARVARVSSITPGRPAAPVARAVVSGLRPKAGWVPPARPPAGPPKGGPCDQAAPGRKAHGWRWLRSVWCSRMPVWLMLPGCPAGPYVGAILLLVWS